MRLLWLGMGNGWAHKPGGELWVGLGLGWVGRRLVDLGLPGSMVMRLLWLGMGNGWIHKRHA